jgi:hypothetical protein
MADTGAPWNIPFAEPTDLVRDWPALSEDVADAVAAGLSAAGSPGIGSNLVQSVKTDTSVISATTFTAISDLSVTITPTTNTSRVIVYASVNASTDFANRAVFIRLERNGSAIYVGDASGTRIQASGVMSGGDNAADQRRIENVAILFVDSPTTTSPVTYRIAGRRGGSGDLKINRNKNNPDDSDTGLTASSIVAVEVAP